MRLQRMMSVWNLEVAVASQGPVMACLVKPAQQLWIAEQELQIVLSSFSFPPGKYRFCCGSTALTDDPQNHKWCHGVFCSNLRLEEACDAQVLSNSASLITSDILFSILGGRLLYCKTLENLCTSEARETEALSELR